MDVEIVPCSIGHLEKLIEGADAFLNAYGLQVVDYVYAHTLAESNASTRVLEKCRMTKVSEAVDPDVGNVWRWEIGAV